MNPGCWIRTLCFCNSLLVVATLEAAACLLFLSLGLFPGVLCCWGCAWQAACVASFLLGWTLSSRPMPAPCAGLALLLGLLIWRVCLESAKLLLQSLDSSSSCSCHLCQLFRLPPRLLICSAPGDCVLEGQVLRQYLLPQLGICGGREWCP